MKLHQNIKGIALALLLMGAGASMAGIAWAANGFVIFGAGGDAATVTNHKLDVNASVAAGGTTQLVAGTAKYGQAAIDQTTPGTTNGVQINAAIPAGTALIGKVGIDQTTPGTTNGVQVNAALPAGSAVIGKTSTDTTTPDVTNLVSVKPSVATFVSGTASQTSTTTTQLIAAVSSKVIYVMAFECANSGSTASTVLFQDGSGGTTLAVTYNPAGSGTNQSGGGVPLFKTTSGNALFFAPGTGSTTQFCSASGFSQ